MLEYYGQKELVLTGVKIFSSDGKLPNEKTISDTTVFFKEDLTYIGIELGFSPCTRHRYAVISWHIYDESGRDLSNKIQATVELSPGMDKIYHSWGYTEKTDGRPESIISLFLWIKECLYLKIFRSKIERPVREINCCHLYLSICY